MAKNVTIMGASYSDVPAVTLPQTGGGTATFRDITTETLSVTANGTYTAASDKAYSSVEVNVSGGGGEVEKKVLNFYDFDGKIVASYANSEIQGLTSLPPAPDHSTDSIPLTFQEWNWTLAQIKAYNTSYPDSFIGVGAIYVPTDGKTHVLFHIDEYDQEGVKLLITTTGGTVDWGDGNTATISGTTLTHVYSTKGDYHCTLTNITKLNCMQGEAFSSKVIHVRYGSTITSFVGNAIRNCYAVKTITIPKTVTEVLGGVCYYSSSLLALNLPSMISSTSTHLVANCLNLRIITMPPTITAIGGTSLTCLSSSVTLPSSLGSIADSLFNGNFNLTAVTIPTTVSSIGQTAFQNCFSLQMIKIPSSVSSIGKNAFNGCRALGTIVLLGTTPPTLDATSGINTTNQKRIYVPASAVETYKGATNWSAFSSIISAIPS